MQNSCLDMDLEEGWEFIPHTGNNFLHRRPGGTTNNLLLKELIVDMNYFICPALTEEEADGERKQPASSDRALCSPDPPRDDGASEDRFFKDIGVVLPPPMVLVSPHPDAASQFFFEKLSSDMKVADSSPRSSARWGAAIAAHYGGDDEEAPVEDPPLPEEEEEEDTEAEGAIRQKNACGFAAWRWHLAGIGAFCSMGAAAAAATFCILLSGGRPQQKRRIQFSICADEKRMKEVVQQATRLNQALLTVSGAAAPMAMADISFGGYYASA